MGQEWAGMREYGVLITIVIIAQGPQGRSKHLPRDGAFPPEFAWRSILAPPRLPWEKLPSQPKYKVWEA